MLPSEQRILNIIRQYIAEHGYAPTLEEIAQEAGLKARSQVHKYVNSLIEQGHLARDGRARRGLKLIEEDTNLLSIPIAGRIAAGQPIEAISGGEELDLKELFLKEGRYPLRISGESMIDVGLHDGDIAIIQHAQTARKGEIVVALIDDCEATLKRFRKLPDGHIELSPENTAMEPMVYEPHRVSIQGTLVCSLRVYNA